MQIDYKFTSDVEPTDEQLHLIMVEVVAEVKNKAMKSDERFWAQLQQLVKAAHEQSLTLNSDTK